MVDKLATIAALWALIVAPSLCRAGLLTACCFPGERPTEMQASGDECCKHTEPLSTPAPSPEPRRCDSCAHICDATVKAPDDSGRFDGCQLITVSYEALPAQSPTLGTWASSAASVAVLDTNLPFPPSDVPLLI